ncbi:hypothetical protein [Prevotella sp. E2-28]|nr:hypothetical protein [Prevotella sp. E2-28]UKK52412.1 hypothetical protein L6465_07240 [Prevotella sp. E2-28]
MKKKYQKPQTLSTPLKSPMLMVSTSTEVNNFSDGDNIYAGDTDDEPNP